MLKVFNTLTRKKEDFVPLDNTVKIYSCGPTVYSFAHIGNMRTYIFMDFLRRVLKYDGYKLKGVLNITDVGHLQSDADEGEDKMERAAKEQKKSPYQIAEEITAVFFDDLKKLNIGKPEIIAKATDHIDEMRSYVEKLFDLGYAYETSDGIYFDIGKFEGYGKLSGISLDGQIAGARVEVNTQKHHPADFALWKKAPKEHIMQWDSRWGRSYPGWHIECSAMSKKYLGKIFDIHTGGVDHIPIHHENEIAQSEALEGQKTVNYWMHGEFMQVDGGKMSKSLNNVYTISDLQKRGYSALDFRYFCINAHYRKKLNFTFEGMDAAKTARERLQGALYSHKISKAKTDAKILERFEKSFEDAINDDLNIPLAMGELWTMIKLDFSEDIYKLALKFDKVFGLDFDKVQAPEKAQQDIEDIPEQIIELAQRRQDARKAKDFALADQLRTQIAQSGYILTDTPSGFSLKKQ